MTQFFDCMLNIETMGSTNDAALIAIGCAFFDLKTETIGPTFSATINLASAVADGGVMDASTVVWWLGQSEDARKGVRFGGRAVRTVLQEFSDWIKETCRHEDVRPWGNSNRFDLGITESAYKRAGIPAPWVHWNERDFRTVGNLYPGVEYDPSRKGDGAHDALTDAVFQINHLFAIKRSRK